MSKLFGVPTGDLALVLAVALAAVIGVATAFALRNRVFFRLGLRNARRRRGRSALIVVGLMLGTAIITAALATGDTMSHTIRSAAVSALGSTDEIVGAKGVGAALTSGTDATGARYFPQGYTSRVAGAARRSGLVDAVAPVIIEPVAVQDLSSKQTEARVKLFATTSSAQRGFGEIRAARKTVRLAALRPGEIYLNAKGADKLGARQGDRLRIYAGSRIATVRVRKIVRYDGAAATGAGLMMALPAAQRFLGVPGRIRAIFVSNSGGVSQSDAVVKSLKPTVGSLGLETDKTKQNALELADAQGATFMSLFTTFGSFSISAGILLIFLIFVMLAAERRGELGIARAVGTRRRQLVEMFVFEGMAYDVIAAAVGVVVGAAVAYGMVYVLAHAFAGLGDFTISYSVTPTSLLIGYALGVLLTFLVVTYSATRVSRMNISTAIRNLPEPPAKARRRRWLWPALGVAFGVLFAVGGVVAKDGLTLGFGFSMVVLSLVPLVRLAGVPDRAAKTCAGLALIIWFVFPISRWLFGELKVNFSIFLFGGLMIVVGATWTIMSNADVLLGALLGTLGRVPVLAPVLRVAVAYPLRSLFRTAVTLAMFTLVVFTLVVGATTTGSFVQAFNDVKTFGGGFDVRATTSAAAPITDLRAALARKGFDLGRLRYVSSESTLPIKVRQLGVGGKEKSYLVNGVDRSFLEHTTYGLAARARGYASSAAVWNALREHRNLAVVDPFTVPRKANWGTQAAPFQLKGFYLEDKVFTPVRIAVRDPQTGTRVVLSVIGVLSDSAPQFMVGIWTSQATLAPVFGNRVLPTTHLFALAPGTDPKAMAKHLESAFLANGMQADSLKKLLADVVSANLTFDRLIMGFMGLGLIVGVAALGVITARAVVERRQQIGVLRAIGFRRRMVQATFLLESSFVALTSIVVGTGLGLATAYFVVDGSRQTPSWENMAFVVPWATLGVIFLVVYLVALATSYASARRAARIFPAEALRYQ